MIRNAALLTLGLLACLARPGLADEPIALKPLTWDEFQKRLASPPEGAKFTIVDAWATTCGPC